MKNKKLLMILGLIAFILGIFIYINPLFLYRNYKLENHITKLTKKEEINPNNLIPFNYDNLYIIYPYTSKKDIEKELNIKSRYIKENNNDNYQTLIVTKNNKVISSIKLSLSYSFQPLKGNNYFKKESNTLIKIYRFGKTHSFIEQHKYIEESFYDITYQLPGSYWEEDDEEPGKFYYLDIDSNEYLLVTKEDKFKYNNYIKNKHIFKEDDIKIKQYNIKYLETKQITSSTNGIDITYIITINEYTYIFNLSTTKDNLAKNKENLYNIIQSIKE